MTYVGMRYVYVGLLKGINRKNMTKKINRVKFPLHFRFKVSICRVINPLISEYESVTTDFDHCLNPKKSDMGGHTMDVLLESE